MLIGQRSAIIADLPVGLGPRRGLSSHGTRSILVSLISAWLRMEFGPEFSGASDSLAQPRLWAPNLPIQQGGEAWETTTTKKCASLLERPGEQKPGKQLVRVLF